jgi:outer membrane protein OmpA-like peptidoglycan-associated protein
MRILIGGFAALAVWITFSAWMYKDNLYPVFNPPEPVVTAVPETTPPPPAPAPAPEKLSVLFNFNDAGFRADPQTESRIAEFTSWLGKNPSAKLSITGHTDQVGEESFNNELGMRRAAALQKHILSLGIAADRLIVTSKGETEPAADNSTEEGRAKNRRTEITIKTE